LTIITIGIWAIGQYEVVSLILAEYSRRHHVYIAQAQWHTKTGPTFSDVITTVRRLFWQKMTFEQPCFHEGYQKLTPKFKKTLLDYLCRAV